MRPAGDGSKADLTYDRAPPAISGVADLMEQDSRWGQGAREYDYQEEDGAPGL